MASRIQYSVLHTVGSIWHVRGPEGQHVATLTIEATSTHDPRALSVDVQAVEPSAMRVLRFDNAGATTRMLELSGPFDSPGSFTCIDIDPKD